MNYVPPVPGRRYPDTVTAYNIAIPVLGVLLASGCPGHTRSARRASEQAPGRDSPATARADHAGATPAPAPVPVAHAPSAPAGDVREVEVVREYPRRPVAATFEVSSTGALIWAYSPEPTRARIEIERAHTPTPGRTHHFQRVFTHTLDIPAETGNTGVYRVTGLKPGQLFRYRVQFGNGDGTEWYSFHTAPEPDEDAPVHFVFGAEVSNDPRYESPMFDVMSRSGASFLISLGDWPYTDLPVRDHSLEQYRSSHRLARTRPPTQRLMQKLSVFAIYDDHEIRNDWHTGTIADERGRVTAAVQAWDEFFPVHDRTPEVRARGVLARRRYRTWRWGKHAQFFMLDTRLFRSPFDDEDGPEKTMLGAEQLAWLKRELMASHASFKFILTTVPMEYGTTREFWGAYQTERAEVYAFLHERRIRGVVFLTADQHWLSIHTLASGHVEYQVGPLMAFLRTPPEERPEEVLFEAVVPNYGEIVITPGVRPHMVFTARDQDGGLLYSDVRER